MILFGDIYRGQRVLVTGHTGFKGSWLALWLNQLGARVAGISLDPDTSPNHFDLLGLNIDDYRLDIRLGDEVGNLVERIRPDMVFHLAAQPLVRRSYLDPLGNWSTNVMGTANVLEACRKVESVRSIVVITTDKVYANQEWSRGYREDDRLGGYDPYSASKAACEILIDSYRKSFFAGSSSAPLMASARAGNVVGGGDWSEDRLIPDLIRSVGANKPLFVRSPQATRPWQHVLECLAGYLLLGQRLSVTRHEYAEAWNFGPGVEDNRTVLEVLTLMQAHWPQLIWEQDNAPQPHEATLLYLDCAKAKDRLNWKPVWTLEKALKATTDWYRQFQEQGAVMSGKQLSEYVADACTSEASWVQK
ncbi:MAG: CDP-glucose 4,6-dehydratase [Proteobacteria bacterium]|nr:CDP-glucose 4,6-dehydratase [Pseudomonadota bacterium]MBU1714518.1 CDP-glucose 4,6-dehydratase [Pseudomonadota bacterium]